MLLSICDTPLEGVAIEDAQDMIKNCPRGDVIVVAQAGPKPPSRSESDELSTAYKANNSMLSSPDLPTLTEEVSLSKSKAEEKPPLDMVSNRTFLQTRVDLPRELVSQEDADVGSTLTNSMVSKCLQSTEQTLIPVTTPPQSLDELVAAEECEAVVENNGLEVTDFDDLPPVTPPPPVPVKDWQLEGSSVPVDEPFVEDNAQDTSLHPPALFDDFFDENQTDTSSVVDDSEVEDAKMTSIQASVLTPLESQPDKKLNSPKNETSFNVADVSATLQPPAMLTDDTQPQLPIKPPSLFGDDTESISTSSPLNATMNSFGEDGLEMDSPSWNGEQTFAIKPPSLFNDELESLPPKPPSLFDDEVESLPSLPRTPSPPKLDKHYIDNYALDAVSSNSSSPVHSPWVKRKSQKDTKKAHRSNVTTISGSDPRSSLSSRGNVSTLEVDDPLSDLRDEPADVQDDDMASLPPAPPPPSPPVNKSASWSVRAPDTKPSLAHGQHEMPYISSPLSPPAKPERKNSKKRILPLRIRSKKGRKSPDEAAPSIRSDHHHESQPQSGQMGFDNNSTSRTNIELPEDDMESLPPAPPPPRMSPLTVESLENYVDGFQPTKVPPLKPHSSQLAPEEHSAEVSHSPKKKKKSFRKNVVQMDFKESESSHQASGPLVSEVNAAVSPIKDDVAVTDSSDAMSPPPLPPEMELWSEAGSAEAELALLDQMLHLEGSSRSGNEHSSEGSSPPSSQRAPFLKDMLEKPSTVTMDVEEEVYKSEETSDQSKPIECSLEPITVASSLQVSSDIETELQPGSPPLDSNSQTDTVGTNEESKSSPVLETDMSYQRLPGRLSKQPSEHHDIGNIVKHRRPAPPIPTGPRTNKSTGSISRKPFPAGIGIAVLPSKPEINRKASPPSHHLTSSHQKEQKIISPAKEKKKLFSRSHKHKQKQADSNHLESPDTSFDEKPDGRGRSRSWTQKLFGFRSRSKSRDKVKGREERSRQTDRSRSVSPPRGVLSKQKRSIPPRSTQPLPSPSTKKVALIGQKKLERGGSAHYITVEQSPRIPVHPSTSEEKHFIEGNNNKREVTADDHFISKMENDVVNADSHANDVVSAVSDESYDIEGEMHRLVQEENELPDIKQSRSLSVESDVVMDVDVHSGLDTSINRPLPALPDKAFYGTYHVNKKEEDVVKDKVPEKSTSKPPVPKKPPFFKSSSELNVQQQKTVDELKRKFNKATSDVERLESDTLEDLEFITQDNEVQDHVSDHQDLPSPGPPTFKPVPPPLALLANVSQNKLDDDGTPVCPNSPGPPRFKPPPPPLALKPTLVPSGEKNDETPDALNSPGPPKFKPEPPPLHLNNENKDRPSLPDKPHFKPLPPLPIAAATMTQTLEDDDTVERNFDQDILVENENLPEMQNVEQRKMKPLPPVPTGFNVKTNDDRDSQESVDVFNHKLSLSRQDAHEEDNIEDADKAEISELQPELSQVQADFTEDNYYSQASEVIEPSTVQNTDNPVNAFHSDEFESSDVSSEWDETCSSTHEDHGLSVPGIKVARSASFSAGDVQIKQQPPSVDDQTRPAPATLKRPPPPMRRRSSSLPHLFPDSEASQGGSGATDYWHTGNLQELINSRNQEPDVDEGVIEVQVSQWFTHYKCQEGGGGGGKWSGIYF